MKSTPGCWAAFGSVLAKEYSDSAYFDVHRLTVDSYAAQHPGQKSRQTIQSIGVHLTRLYLFLEKGLIEKHANDAMLRASKQKHTFTWLTPPASLGALTIEDVAKAGNAEEHSVIVRKWAAGIWDAWAPHHHTIISWTNH